MSKCQLRTLLVAEMSRAGRARMTGVYWTLRTECSDGRGASRTYCV
jgi:hypothetical protein